MTAKKEEAMPKNEEDRRMIFEGGLSRECSGRERSNLKCPSHPNFLYMGQIDGIRIDCMGRAKFHSKKSSGYI